MEQNVLSVSQLNGYIKMLVERDEVLSYVTLRGEISNFKYHTSGHLYFTLKDTESEISAVMFRAAASKLIFEPKNGMLVTVYGRVSVYEKSGKYQIYVNAMSDDGLGRMYIELERLKKKLAAEGIFDEKRKRELPVFPKCIGIVTSPTGAAVRDMINITGRRYPEAKLLISPAMVQGEYAPASICEALSLLYAYGGCDVIIVGRGGGSAEDLWAFNNEELVRTVAASPVPIISAVGHETDFTLCDLAADRRAPTPSAAAEMAVPDRSELIMRLIDGEERLWGGLRNYVVSATKLLGEKKRILGLSSPDTKLLAMKERYSYSVSQLHGNIQNMTERAKLRFSQNIGTLESMNPLAVMKRGYSAVRRGDGAIVDSVEKIKENDSVELILADGIAEARIGHIIKNTDRKKGDV